MLAKFCTFYFARNRVGSYGNYQPLFPPSLKCHLLLEFSLSVFKLLFRHHLVVFMPILELSFSIFHLLFLDIAIQCCHSLLTNLV